MKDVITAVQLIYYISSFPPYRILGTHNIYLKLCKSTPVNYVSSAKKINLVPNIFAVIQEEQFKHGTI